MLQDEKNSAVAAFKEANKQKNLFEAISLFQIHADKTLGSISFFSYDSLIKNISSGICNISQTLTHLSPPPQPAKQNQWSIDDK